MKLSNNIWIFGSCLTVLSACGGGSSAIGDRLSTPSSDPVTQQSLSGQSRSIYYNNCSGPTSGYEEGTATARLMGEDGLQITIDPTEYQKCTAVISVAHAEYGRGTVNGNEARWAEGRFTVECSAGCPSTYCQPRSSNARIMFTAPMQSKLELKVNRSDKNGFPAHEKAAVESVRFEFEGLGLSSSSCSIEVFTQK